MAYILEISEDEIASLLTMCYYLFLLIGKARGSIALLLTKHI